MPGTRILHPGTSLPLDLMDYYCYKVPRGYDAEHLNAEFLMYNGLTARVEEEVPDVFYSDALIEYAYTHYKNMLPLHRWLKNALDE